MTLEIPRSREEVLHAARARDAGLGDAEETAGECPPVISPGFASLPACSASRSERLIEASHAGSDANPFLTGCAARRRKQPRPDRSPESRLSRRRQQP